MLTTTMSGACLVEKHAIHMGHTNPSAKPELSRAGGSSRAGAGGPSRAGASGSAHCADRACLSRSAC